MSPTPDLSAAALSPAQVKRLVASHDLDTVLAVTPQHDKTIKISQRYPVEPQRVTSLKEALAAEGMALGPDDEEGNFSVLGFLKTRPLPVPDALLADTPEVQG